MSTSTYNEPLLTCYAMRYPDLMAGYCFGVPSMCNFGALLSHWKDHGSQGAPLAFGLPRAPPAAATRASTPVPSTEPRARHRSSRLAEGRIRACISEDTKCYALDNPELLTSYCNGKFEECDWNKAQFLRHWSATGYKQFTGTGPPRLGCDTAEARCYVKDNPDVEEYVCGGSIDRCNWIDVHQHFYEAGQAEGRTFSCPPPSPPNPPPHPPRPPPFQWMSTHAAKSGPPVGDADTCRASSVRLIWLVATNAEATALVSRMSLSACGGPLPMFQKGEQMLVVSGRGRAKAAAAVAWASARNDDVGGLAWLNVGLGGHRTLPLGEVRGLSPLYDVGTGGQYFPGQEALAGLKTAMGATVDRPVTTYSLDAVYDMEAAPFFEIASMLSEPQLIASVKVVSDKSGNREPDEATAEQWLGKAWPQLKQVGVRLVALARRRRARALESAAGLGGGNHSDVVLVEEVLNASAAS